MRPEDAKNGGEGLPILSGLKNIHGDRAVAIVGGGSTVINDLSFVPPDSVIISVNHYTHILDIECDYMVFADNPNARENIKEAMDRNHGKRVSIYQPWSDFDLDIQPYFIGMSITMAIWLACHVTSGKVYLCGVDCCTSNPTHFTGFHDEREYNKPIADKMHPIIKTIKRNGYQGRIVALREPLKSWIN